MTRTLILAAATALVAGTAFAGGVSPQDAFVRHAIESNERANAAAIANGADEVVTFSTKSPSVSALEVALKHAEENDNRQKAAYLRAQLGR